MDKKKKFTEQKKKGKKESPIVRQSVKKTLVTEEDIARRAYEIYLERGCLAGHELEDWAQAEKELKGKI